MHLTIITCNLDTIESVTSRAGISGPFTVWTAVLQHKHHVDTDSTYDSRMQADGYRVMRLTLTLSLPLTFLSVHYLSTYLDTGVTMVQW